MATARLAAARPSPAARTATVALFDLDRTMLRGSSLARYGRAVVTRGMVDRAVLRRHLAHEAVFAARGMRSGALERLSVSLLQLVSGRENEPLVGLAHEVGAALAAEVYAGARWLLEWHQEAGDRCILVSAAPQDLVEAVGAALRFDTAVGTVPEVVDGRLTGRLSSVLCHGPGKLVRLREAVGPLELATATAYGDSGSDIPLLESCRHPVAVNPDRHLRQVAVARHWPVVRFC
jgi:HAD superfamily hydrolase (TIGR01490 family)